jgi:oxygen-independent coproporphyrinogen-3 oxidase
MSGIYIHIPFCKQACHYCDFHFSTSLKKKKELIEALCSELVLRKSDLKDEVQTIYFGGGTPSLLSSEELEEIFTTIFENYTIAEGAEITLEANPDDLSLELINQFDSSPINRLSIGVQSFFENDLKLMNRAHNANEALECIKIAKNKFQNISIDLIYGIPGMDVERWNKNLDIAMSLGVPHLSCYALTVEPKTALASFIKKGKVAPVDDEISAEHYRILQEVAHREGYENYEFSNFGMKGYESKNNMAYWQGKHYLGIGPSAHSYDGDTRSWNVSNNSIYIKSIQSGSLPFAYETLSTEDKYNEYIMTGLRTKWGVSLDNIERSFGHKFREHLIKQAANYVVDGMLDWDNEVLHVTKKGKFLSDGIAANLFLVNLD